VRKVVLDLFFLFVIHLCVMDCWQIQGGNIIYWLLIGFWDVGIVLKINASLWDFYGIMFGKVRHLSPVRSLSFSPRDPDIWLKCLQKKEGRKICMKDLFIIDHYLSLLWYKNTVSLNQYLCKLFISVKRFKTLDSTNNLSHHPVS